MKTILILDDHKVVGEGIKLILDQVGIYHTTYLETIDQVNEMITNKTFDLYIIDIHIKQRSGIELAKQIINKDKNNRVLLYTGFESYTQLDLIDEIGIYGVMSKSASPEELMLTVQAALLGYAVIPINQIVQSIFSKRQTNNNLFENKEIDILIDLSNGQSNRELAEKYFMSTRSIEYLLTKIYKKLEVNSRSEAIAKAIKLELIEVK
ncbi:response regulator transcription factor [Lysinibacillus sphaericus]|uniref:response regulator transcription factor n=1 Tax=Lysinibacillus sphaericus TaxID=1421 RepID=UPI003D70A451